VRGEGRGECGDWGVWRLGSVDRRVMIYEKLNTIMNELAAESSSK
jgi:hypothetical protein